MKKTPQELQHEFNDGVQKVLTELVGLGSESTRSRDILFDLINLNSKQLESQQNLIDVLMAERVDRMDMKPKPIYDHFEVDGFDLILFFYFPEDEETTEMTVKGFIPKDYNIKVIGDEEITLWDYGTRAFIYNTMSESDFQELLEKELNDGI